MIYPYKRGANGHIKERKARCAARGPNSPDCTLQAEHTTSPTVDKSVVPPLFAIAEMQRLHLDNFDVRSAFRKEPYGFDKPVYIRQHPQIVGSLKYRSRPQRLV